MPTAFRNSLLKSLHPDSIERLHLEPILLPLRHTIEFPGSEINTLIFLEDGVASMTATFRDGAEVELTVLGFEGFIGASLLVGRSQSLNRVSMQIAGHGYSISPAHARLEFGRFGRFHDLTLASTYAQFLQTAQTAGCNAAHTVEQRLARWLLLCFDRVEGSIVRCPHEHIAAMLGCNRSTVTVAAGKLQHEGVITYTRGKIHLNDRTRLELHACECYHVLFDYLADDASRADPGTSVSAAWTE